MERLDIIQYVRSALGFPIVDVEIDTSNAGPVDYAIERTLRLYNRFRPHVRTAWFTVVPDVMKYDFDALDLPYGYGVYDVRPPVRGGNMWLAYESSLLGLPGSMIRLTYGRELSDFLAIYGEIEQIQRVTARDFDWIWRVETVTVGQSTEEHWTLYISPKPYEGNEVEYEYLVGSTLATIREKDESWVQDHIRAQLMIHLGRGRSKWANELPMDGATMLSDGQAELKDLEDEIRRRRRPYLVPQQG